MKNRIIKILHKNYIDPKRYPDKFIYINIIKLFKFAINNTKYFIYFYYNKTKKVEIYIIKIKSKAFNKFILFQSS